MAAPDNNNEQLKAMDEKINLILAFIRGNSLNADDKGLAGRVSSIDERVKGLEKWKDRVVWMVVGMGIPASIGVVEILKKLFIK